MATNPENYGMINPPKGEKVKTVSSSKQYRRSRFGRTELFLRQQAGKKIDAAKNMVKTTVTKVWKPGGTVPEPGTRKLPTLAPNPTALDSFVGSLKKDYTRLQSWGKTVGSIGKKMYSPFRPAVNTLMKGGVDSGVKVTRQGNIITRSTRKGNPLLRGATAARRMVKSLPKPVRKGGILGGAIVGATAMLGLAVMKGAMNESRDIVYERYMQDQAITKNVLNNTRMGLAAGTSRMQNMGSTIGLSNALSRTRHG